MVGGAIHSETTLRITSYMFSGFIYLFSFAYAVLGFGLWRLRNWARRAILALFLLVTLTTVMAFFFHVKSFPSDAFSVVLSISFSVCLFWYLMQHRVRSAFGALPPVLPPSC
jgi:uncharacterized membrane protein YeiB